MTTTNRSKRILTLAVVAMATVVLATTSANAGTIVYEGFQYSDVGDELVGQPDGVGTPADIDATGLAGTWQDPTSGDKENMFLKSGSLVFGDLLTAGNTVGYISHIDNDRANRALTAGAQSSIGGASEIYFSILLEKLQTTGWGAAQGGFVLADTVVNNAKIPSSSGHVGFGVAPPNTGAAGEDEWTAYAWDASGMQEGDASLTVNVFQTSTGSLTPPTHNVTDVHLLVGHISFDTGTGGADQYTLYDYVLNGGSVVGGTLNPICSTLEVDVNQGDLDTVNLTRQVNLNYDELRIGTSLADVVPRVPEPSTFPLVAIGLLCLIGFGRWRKR